MLLCVAAAQSVGVYHFKTFSFWEDKKNISSQSTSSPLYTNRFVTSFVKRTNVIVENWEQKQGQELITSMNKDQSDAVFGAIVALMSDWLWLFWVKSTSRSFCHQKKTCSVFSELSDWVSHGFTSQTQRASVLRLWRSASALHHQPSILCRTTRCILFCSSVL